MLGDVPGADQGLGIVFQQGANALEVLNEVLNEVLAYQVRRDIVASAHLPQPRQQIAGLPGVSLGRSQHPSEVGVDLHYCGSQPIALRNQALR